MTTLNDDNIGVQPDKALNENQSFGNTGETIPEQAQVATATMPRQMSVFNLIYQWQPMGFRVILDLPFIGDDQNFIFAIRNGPFIPQRTVKPHYDIIMSVGNTELNRGGWTEGVMSFAYNNMIPVILPSDDSTNYPDPAKPPITLTNYDYPPTIASIAQSFRRWRGDMQYRIRMVAGFATQGYVMCSSLKNVFSPVGIYNQFKTAPTLQRQDISFRPAMQNSYALSDTSMFRHLELTYPYDYPTPYYDQYAWISRRVVPSYQFMPNDILNPGKYSLRNRLVQTEPHGDNWIVFGIRGDLEASEVGSQVVFELEYRCMEGFQFADPFLPPKLITQPFSDMPKNRRVYRVPNSKWTSDGVGLPKPVTNATARSVNAANINIGVQGNLKIGNMDTASIHYTDNQQHNVEAINIPAGRRREKKTRTPRDVDDDVGVDTVDNEVEQYDTIRKLRDRSLKLFGTSSRNE